MTNPLSRPEATNWQKGFIQRFNACKASLRSLQMEKERLYPQRNKGTLQKLSIYFDALDTAFAAINVKKPEPRNRGSNDDRAIEKGLIGLAELAALSDEELERYGEK